MTAVPFDLPDVGLREIKGEAYLDQGFIVLVVEDALAGEFDREQQIIKVEPSALADVRFERGILKDKICLRPKTRELLDTMPGRHLAELKLRVWVKHRESARRLVEAIQEERWPSDQT